MDFEWDDDKNNINRAKHGIRFESARAVFLDPFVVLIQDRYVLGEERWQAIGMIGTLQIVVVAHSYRGEFYGEERIRIISARQATPGERRRYGAGLG